ncbi:MAG: VWA domain-containing protein [Myxococcota bacterium]
MEFANPAAFLLLVPVALLPLQRWLTGRNVLAIPRLKDRNRRLTLRLLLAWVPAVLQIAALALMVVALARPRLTRRDVRVDSEGLDIILAVDTSGSMRATDFSLSTGQVNRLQVAKGVMAEFIRGRPHDRIGVVVFGEEAFTHVPLTIDHDTLLNIMDQVEIGVAGAQRTAIGSAIAVSAKRLKDLTAPDRLVILLTDGRDNGDQISPMEAAQAAAALDIKLYTVGVGAQQRSPALMRLADGLDERGLAQIAEVTAGQYFRATDAKSLERIYETIDQLEPSPAEVIELVQHEELYRRFLVPGVMLLGLQLLLSGTVLRRGP